MSSKQIFSHSLKITSETLFVTFFTFCKILSTAQAKFTAVGLACFNSLAFCSKKTKSSFNKEAKYMPCAAVAPINGAPRTCIVLIALTTSSKVLNEIILNSNGSKV